MTATILADATPDERARLEVLWTLHFYGGPAAAFPPAALASLAADGLVERDGAFARATVRGAMLAQQLFFNGHLPLMCCHVPAALPEPIA